MCGIAGVLDRSCSRSHQELESSVAGMATTLAHRGPDDAGVWVDSRAGIALGHRRLAILDLSPAGHQPMVSASARWALVFNGEIYNHRSIRKELEVRGVRFRGTADTEVLLEAIARWGVPGALKRANGMFAFAAWDRRDRTLYLARDRLGEKPLYYGWHRGALLFGSELKALRAHPSFDGSIDRNSLDLYFRHNNVPAPWTIFERTWKLPAANYAIVRPENGQGQLEPVAYWSAATAAELGTRAFHTDTFEAATERLHDLVADAVKLRLEADVPLGALLSGGVDSSTIVALMQAQTSQPIRTYTVGFREAGFDEAAFARDVARRLGTDHQELYVTPAESRSVIPRLPELYDEPFGDSSQIPTFLISQLARREVKVALSGDGGDEVFGGYARHMWAPRIWSWTRHVPARLRRAAGAALIAGSSENRIERLSRARWTPSSPFSEGGFTQRARKLASALAAKDRSDFYLRLVSPTEGNRPVVLGTDHRSTIVGDESCWPKLPSFAEQMMYLDLVTYLPDDILVKVDRASMAVNLEVRAPFLDHRVVEFAWHSPLRWKIGRQQGKRILREVLGRYVPKGLVERPKAGFAIPIAAWLRGPLREWAEDLLSEALLRREGLLDPCLVRQAWAEHLTGRPGWEQHLWAVLMFEAWLAHQQSPVIHSP